METVARYRGSLLGLAAGDALGTTLEFRSPGSFSHIEDMMGGGPFRLKPGQWTDDTSMALCLFRCPAKAPGPLTAWRAAWMPAGIWEGCSLVRSTG